MRLSDMVTERVLKAIGNLKILESERATLDWEVTPVVIQMKGADSPVTVYTISLLGPLPTTLGDHASFTETMMDPYSPQADYDLLVERLLELVRETQQQDVPAGFRQPEPRSKSGLFLPR
jgi:hypothetical protein